jgi:hypothetical protein
VQAMTEEKTIVSRKPDFNIGERNRSRVFGNSLITPENFLIPVRKFPVNFRCPAIAQARKYLIQRHFRALRQRGPDVFPFTGRKDSAEGTLSVTDALRSFSIRSMIAAKQTDASKKLLDAIVLHHTSKFINTRFIF